MQTSLLWWVRQFRWVWLPLCLVGYSACWTQQGSSGGWNGSGSSSSWDNSSQCWFGGGGGNTNSNTSGGSGTSQAPALDTSMLSTLASSPTHSVQAEEGDIIRQKGSLLFMMHPYRGFVVVDQSKVAKPQILATLPVHGYPVEMFVTEKVAFLLLKSVWLHHLDEDSILSFFSTEPKTMLWSIDIQNPQKPKVLGRLALSGEIKVGAARKQGDFIYVVSRHEALLWNKWTEPVQSATNWDIRDVYVPPTSFYGASVLQEINVAKPENMYVVRGHLLKGREELSRPIQRDFGDFVKDGSAPNTSQAVATNTVSASQPCVARFVARERSPEMGRIDFEEYIGTVITSMNGRLMVAENWLASMTVDIAGELRWGQQQQYSPFSLRVRLNMTVVSVFDITDSSGKAELVSRIPLHGAMTDQFKQANYIHRSEGELYLGVVRRSRIKVSHSHVWSEVQNDLLIVSLAKHRSPDLLQSLPFGKPLETVRGSYFDMSREVLYAITATGGDTDRTGTQEGITGKRALPKDVQGFDRIIDPLYAIEFANPKQAKVMSAIDGLSGDIHLFRPIHQGMYLLAVGRDTSAQCNGFDETTQSYSRTAVSLFDTRNLSKLRLVQRKCVTIRPDVKVVNSSLNWDRDQAHKYIGMYESSDSSWLSVPVEYAVQEQKQTIPRTAVGIMRWDVRRDDPNLPPEKQNVLSLLGTVEHPEGVILRTFWSTAKATQPTLVLSNLSWDALTHTDVLAESKPQILGTLFLQPRVERIYRFGDYVVEQISESREVPLASPNKLVDARTWRVLRVSDAPYVRFEEEHQFSWPNVSSVLRWNQLLLVFYDKIDTAHQQESKLQVIDMSIPIKPVFSTPLKIHVLPDVAENLFLEGTQSVSGWWVTVGSGWIFARPHPKDRTRQQIFWINLSVPQSPEFQLLDTVQGSSIVLHPGHATTFFASWTKTQAGGAVSHVVGSWEYKDKRWHLLYQREIPGGLLGVEPTSDTHRWLLMVATQNKNLVQDVSLFSVSSQEPTQGPVLLDTLSGIDLMPGSVVKMGNTLLLRGSSFVRAYSIQKERLTETWSLKGRWDDLVLAGYQPPYLLVWRNQKRILYGIDVSADKSHRQGIFGTIHYLWNDSSNLVMRYEYPVDSTTWLKDRWLVASGKMGVLEYSVNDIHWIPYRP